MPTVPDEAFCNRGVCAAERGHKGTCPEASGWTDEDDDPTQVQWLTEWALEVTWRDWKKAGAKGPTSQFGPFENRDHLDEFEKTQRRDRDIRATRVLTRRAAYTPWTGPDTPEPTTEREREQLLADLHRQLSYAYPETSPR
jgi:hypothetical protein